MADRLLNKRDVREKLSILPPWPQTDHLEIISHDENPFRKEHGLAGKFVVMYSGNHGQTTPVKTVLKAAVRMQDRENLVFLFVGGGVGKRDVKETIAEHQPSNIIDLPYQPMDQLRYSLSAADVHVVTMGDNVVGVIHPCKVYGAMALAKPILLIGPSECHIADIMENQHIGWHVQHGDVEGTISAIDQMLDMPPEEFQAIGEEAANLVHDRFHQPRMINEFVEIMLRGLPLQDQTVQDVSAENIHEQHSI